MAFALQDRQAVPVRPQPTLEQGIAVVQQMVCRDGRRHRAFGLTHIGHPFCRCQMLEHDLQCRISLTQGPHHLIDKDRLAIKQIDRRIGDLAMHQQRHPTALHGIQRGTTMPQQIRHPGIRVRRRPGRI